MCTLQILKQLLFTMKTRLLLSFVLVLGMSAKAQVNAYSYSTSTGNALATGSFTNLLGTFLDDDVSAMANIGFTFKFNGVNYTNFSVTSNGLIELGASAVTDYNNVIGNLSGPYLIPYWDDNYTDANGSVNYQTSGSAGSRILVIDYHLSYLGNSGAADKNFQIWLYETSNIVKFIYGAGNDFNGGYSVGILTNGVSDFVSVTTASNTSSIVTTNDNNTTWPGSGRSYTFTPIAFPVSQNQTNVSCFGGSNGSATVTPSGGTSPYTYSWAPSGGTGSTASGLIAGTYICTITDAVSASVTSTFTITQPPVLSVTAASQTNVSCFGGSNGAASINTPTGGAGGYTYNWTPGNPTGDGTVSVTGLSATTYTCTVTDANSCVASQSFTVTQPTAISVTPASQTNVSCFGGSNGAASINTPTGGAGGYTYNWTPGTPTGDGTVSVTGLAAGTWTCTVTDANGCVASQNFTVTQPTAISVTPASQTNVSCFGGSNGAASINTPTGGAGGYTYNWTPGNPTGDGTVSVTGLSATTYTCTVTDANSCVASQSFTVTQPTAISVTPASQTNVSCFGGSNGAASINTPTGGAGGYTYNWTPGTSNR